MGHGDAQNGQHDNKIVPRPLVLQGGQRAQDRSDQAPQQHAAEADDGGGGHAGGHRANHRLPLVLHGHTEFAVQQIVHIDEILLEQGLVQAVLGHHRLPDALRRFAGHFKGLSRDRVHQEKGCRCHQKQRQQHG